MPPVFGPVSPSPTRLWSWAAASGSASLPSTEREKAHLLAIEKILDDDFHPGGAEPALDQGRVDRLVGGVEIEGDGDTLAGGEAVGLDHDGCPAPSDVGLGRRRIPKIAVGGGRDAGLAAEILHKGFRAFECGRCGARPKGRNTLGFERVDQPEDERRFRADDDELDPFLPTEPDKPRNVGRANRHAFRFLGDPGIARRAVEPVDQGRGGNRPGERMLASARSHDQDAHCAPPERTLSPHPVGESGKEKGRPLQHH